MDNLIFSHPILQYGALGLLIIVLIWVIKSEKSERAELRAELKDCTRIIIRSAKKQSANMLGDILVNDVKCCTSEDIQHALEIQRSRDAADSL